MSYRVVVKTLADPDWVRNQLLFATEADADGYRITLFARWEALIDAKIFETTEPANVRWANGSLVFIQNEVNEDSK